jgi:hypothetical protein
VLSASWTHAAMSQPSQERLEVPISPSHHGSASPNISAAENVLERLRKAGPDLQAHMLLMDQIDFAATSLGPLSTWSQELATQFYLTMMTPVPQSITLGPDSIVLYNAAYGKLIRDYHPYYFGRSVTTWVEWAPYFPTMQKIMTEAASNGRAVQEDHFVMYLPVDGIFEEVSMSITVIALPSPLSGFHATFQDTTLSMVRERRIDSLKEFSECWKSAESLDDLWMNLFNQLRGRPNQFCFTTLYTASSTVDAGNASDSSSGGGDSEDVVYTVYPDTDVKATDSLATIDLTSTSIPLNAYFRKARSIRAPVLLPHEAIPEHWQQLAQGRGFGDICRQAVIIPSSSNKLTKVQAFLILGLSTRRPYDDAYRTFLLEVQRILADSVINIITAREVANKKRDMAKRARIEKDLIEKELVLRKQEAEIASSKVDRLAEVAESVEYAITCPRDHGTEAQEQFQGGAMVTCPDLCSSAALAYRSGLLPRGTSASFSNFCHVAYSQPLLTWY